MAAKENVAGGKRFHTAGYAMLALLMLAEEEQNLATRRKRKSLASSRVCLRHLSLEARCTAPCLRSAAYREAEGEPDREGGWADRERQYTRRSRWLTGRCGWEEKGFKLRAVLALFVVLAEERGAEISHEEG